MEAGASAQSSFTDNISNHGRCHRNNTRTDNYSQQCEHQKLSVFALKGSNANDHVTSLNQSGLNENLNLSVSNPTRSSESDFPGPSIPPMVTLTCTQTSLDRGFVVEDPEESESAKRCDGSIDWENDMEMI